MASVTLTTLRARVRELADMTGSSFVTDAATSIDAFINAGMDELYDLIIDAYGEDYFISSAALTTASGNSLYALPSDFGKLRGVDLPYGGETVALKRFEFEERNAYKASANTGQVPRYRLEGSNIRLYPAPNSVMAGTLWYIPARALLVNGTDAVNFPNGWEELGVVSAAVRCKEKEESDISGLLVLKDALSQRIKSAATPRDAGEPTKAVDADAPYRGGFPWWGV